MLQQFWHNIEGNGYEILLAGLLANFFAQAYKVLTFAVKRRKFNLSIFVASGGMPSSHSSTVTAIATSCGLVVGFNSPVFALAFVFANIVMYDASGVRRAASRQAVVLNRIVRDILSPDHSLRKEKLKEFVGHTPTEVLVGGLLGILVGIGTWYLVRLQTGAL